MSEIYTTETILRYLDGEMEPGEVAAFETALASNASLQEEVAQLRTAIGAVQLAGAESRVRSIHAEMRMQPAKAKTIPMFPPVFMRVAAAAVVLIALASAWFYSVSATDRIMGDHFVPYTLDASRSGSTFSARENAFMRGNYAAVTGSIGVQPWASRDSLLTALSYYNTGKFNDAAHWFRPLQLSAQYHWDADYYLAFSLLADGKRKEALTIFRKINSDNGHLYHSVVTEAMIRKIGFRSR